jgi:hypothetical protein
VVDQRWLHPSDASATDRFQYGYDRDGNPLYRNNLVNTAFGELYHASGVTDTWDGSGNLLTTGYDRLNQLTAFARGTLSGAALDTITSPTHSQSWSLDALGNWSSVTTDAATQTRTHNAQNEITGISGAGTVSYDGNGNLTADGSGAALTYDAWNRLATDSSGTTSYG